jgi:lipopolysaccharide/colanic/teichoic acid biosynthesis glycosyltransferase
MTFCKLLKEGLNVSNPNNSKKVIKDEWIRKYNPQQRLLTGKAYLVTKRAFDLTLLILSSIFWVPLLLLIMLIIWLPSPKDPVFFAQNRTGRGGKRFKMLKFRSMVPNAEALIGTLAKLNSSGELAGPLKLEKDPRITPIGRFLRKTSLDEIPQLIK